MITPIRYIAVPEKYPGTCGGCCFSNMGIGTKCSHPSDCFPSEIGCAKEMIIFKKESLISKAIKCIKSCMVSPSYAT